MLSTSDQSFRTSSRLIRTLHGLSLPTGKATAKSFVNTFGRLIDLADSVGIADFLKSLNKRKKVSSLARNSVTNTDAVALENDLKSQFVTIRSERVAFIAKSFMVDARDLPFRLVRPADNQFSLEDLGFKSCQRFYALHQSEMDFHILTLLHGIRESLSAHSAEMAKLVLLDRALTDILAGHARKVFSSIPTLLQQRFSSLRNKYGLTESLSEDADIDPHLEAINTLLEQFFKELQTVLLAELDVRLQPVLGLIEALMNAGDSVVS